MIVSFQVTIAIRPGQTGAIQQSEYRDFFCAGRRFHDPELFENGKFFSGVEGGIDSQALADIP
jgi:hypothetical protein